MAKGSIAMANKKKEDSPVWYREEGEMERSPLGALKQLGC